MPPLKIASWNINGIKARLNLLKNWLITEQPDILCLQEIKSTDETFPRGPLEELGYHVETHGQKSFNGVAILSKSSPLEVKKDLLPPQEDPQARYLEQLFDVNGQILRVASLYCPNGNPVESEKLTYKKKWFDALEQRLKQLYSLEENAVFIGDYNIIPTPYDAKTPSAWTNDALFLPEIRDYFSRLQNLGFTDAIRTLNNQPCYTFWDYQARSWERDEGIRIDHALLSPEAANKLLKAFVQKEVRRRERPFDHVPIWIYLAL